MKKVNIKRDELYTQYMLFDKSVSECAEYFNCSETMIRRLLDIFDIYKLPFR